MSAVCGQLSGTSEVRSEGGLKGSVVRNFVCSVAFPSFQNDVSNDESTTWLSRPIGGLGS